MRRRAFLAALPLLAAPLGARAVPADYAEVVPGRALEFPRDHGAHPDYRVEWWYVTGWLEGRLGFQVTFFRVRPREQSDNPSAFNPRQILVAHAALADPARGRLLHDQRAARAALGLAGAEEGGTRVWLDDWRLELAGGAYRARVAAREFELELEFAPRAPLVLQGEGGFSRKGRRPNEASYYYSRPHLAVRGRVDGRAVGGEAWLDHEWSSAYLAPEAAGWDWCGLNLAGGASLMAFRMRARQGGVHYAPPGVSFKPLRTWRSPRTGVEYPVQMQVNDLRLEPLMDDQELDSRASTGAIYWEGAVRAFRGAQEVGKGYLELTGYGRPMTL